MPMIIENAALKKYNTFKLDVSAKLFAVFCNIEELIELLNSDIVKNDNKLILGGGSNILFSSDFDGVVLKNEITGIKILSEFENKVFVRAGAGVEWDDFVKWTVANDYWGVENLSLIPGTVGAAPIQNIGAYGVEVKDVVREVEFVVIDTREIKTLSNKDLLFGYRESIFKSSLKNKTVITSVVFELSKTPIVIDNYGSIKNELIKRGIHNPTLKDMSTTISEIRKQKLPDIESAGSAGSFFKNPVVSKNKFSKIKKEYPDVVYYELDENNVKIPAGWLIEMCGFKGKRTGDVGTYRNQALVIINYGNATGEEILNFSGEIQKAVRNKFEIEIKPEVNII